jgi:hypothetical protein
MTGGHPSQVYNCSIALSLITQPTPLSQLQVAGNDIVSQQRDVELYSELQTTYLETNK